MSDPVGGVGDIRRVSASAGAAQETPGTFAVSVEEDPQNTPPAKRRSEADRTSFDFWGNGDMTVAGFVGFAMDRWFPDVFENTNDTQRRNACMQVGNYLLNRPENVLLRNKGMTSANEKIPVGAHLHVPAASPPNAEGKSRTPSLRQAVAWVLRQPGSLKRLDAHLNAAAALMPASRNPIPTGSGEPEGIPGF